MSPLKDSGDSLGVLRTGRILLLPWQMVLLLSVYVGVVLNGAVFARRLAELGKLGAPTEPGALMTFFNVVIGYGVVQAVLTTDVDLSKEAVGVGLLLWFVSLAVIPLVLWWRYVHVRRKPVSSWMVRVQQLGGKVGLVLLFAVAFAVIAQRVNSDQSGADPVGQDIGQASLAAHTYVPSNWVAGLGMSASNAWDSWVSKDEKLDPAKQFQYSQSAAMDDVFVVVVIGESARSANFGLLGYGRPTTPLLSAEKNLVAFKGTSCNTSTKLSLQCMFVRPQGVVERGLQAPRVLEETVFSVLRTLGFSVELFAMQSEVWFYNSLKSDFYKIREVMRQMRLTVENP